MFSRKSPAQPLRAEAVSPTRRGLLALACVCCALPRLAAAAPAVTAGAARPIHAKLDAAAKAIEERMIAWRRDIHQNPELGNQERRTAALVAAHLRGLGYEVREGVAVTGVVGVLRGGAGDGPVVALRADMDALPVAEQVDLPFASRARTQWGGEEVGVMHACGHDCHVAIQMAVAEVLAAHRNEIRGTVKLIFQPAEEKLPLGEIGGARLMVQQGVMADPKPDAVFGLHVVAGLPVGELRYRAGAVTASSDGFRMTITGKQTHGAMPWAGVDPVVSGAQIVTAMQTLVSRETDITRQAAVLSVGTFHAGTRYNIIPEKVEMSGTLRTFDEATRQRIMGRLKEMAEGMAASMGAKAEVIWEANGYPPVQADTALVERMAPSLARVAGEKAREGERSSAGEDFSYFAQVSPGMFFMVGIDAPGTQGAAPNHSPRFRVDEAGLITGLRAMLHIVADYTGSGMPA
ncbi:amidohydrolase [Roseomonas populi]|uniref:Amidohydrolase n=1 Tax=Roseomonas populi TaxID=3121582 RepID=A0ABT1X1H3_9PROT|nr:amidohydrolase [Roseomonas pecuniae]MCR0981243.1 amidohydrolase [Roseomonas pecuniae]